MPPLEGTDKLTPHYSILNWSKVSLVKETLEMNKFSNKFGWIDFGMHHFTKENYSKKSNGRPDLFREVPEQIKMMSIHYFDPSSFENRRNHYNYINDQLVGSVFTGSAKNLLMFYKLMDEQIAIALDEGFCPTDEPLYPMIYCRYPELFSLFFGDFPSMLYNYNRIRGGLHKILPYLKVCINRKDPFKRHQQIYDQINSSLVTLGTDLQSGLMMTVEQIDEYAELTKILHS